MRNENIKRLFDIVRENFKTPYEYIPHAEQLKRPEWKYYRLYVAVVRKYTCELCGQKTHKKFNIHHKEYKKGLMLWQYPIDGVMFLCAFHHFKVHSPEILSKTNSFKSIKDICNGRK